MRNPSAFTGASGSLSGIFVSRVKIYADETLFASSRNLKNTIISKNVTDYLVKLDYKT